MPVKDSMLNKFHGIRVTILCITSLHKCLNSISDLKMLKINSMYYVLCKSGVFFKNCTIKIHTTQDCTKQGLTVLDIRIEVTVWSITSHERFSCLCFSIFHDKIGIHHIIFIFGKTRPVDNWSDHLLL